MATNLSRKAGDVTQLTQSSLACTRPSVTLSAVHSPGLVYIENLGAPLRDRGGEPQKSQLLVFVILVLSFLFHWTSQQHIPFIDTYHISETPFRTAVWNYSELLLTKKQLFPGGISQSFLWTTTPSQTLSPGS